MSFLFTNARRRCGKELRLAALRPGAPGRFEVRGSNEEARSASSFLPCTSNFAPLVPTRAPPSPAVAHHPGVDVFPLHERERAARRRAAAGRAASPRPPQVEALGCDREG